jgi:hypothetical protein
MEIGDFAAVKSTDVTNDKALYPFTVPWVPCQLLALYTDSTASGDSRVVRIEIRLLQYSSGTTSCEPSNRITERNPPETMIVEARDLLGPLILQRPGVDSITDFKALQSHLPFMECRSSKSLNIELGKVLTMSKIYTTDDIVCLSQVVNHKFGVSKIPQITGQQVFQPNKSSHNPGEPWVNNKAFRVDSSKLRAFYKELVLVPKYKTCEGGINYEYNTKQMVVKMGDTVLIRFEGCKRHPFDCNWAVAEVVAIFKQYTSKSDLEQDERLDPSESQFGKFKVEIRWFYERRDISTVPVSQETSKSQEVFETDHTQIMDAGASLLAPATLVESQKNVNGQIDGPALTFFCQRFWSTQRKSLIPCNGLEGRKRRGLIHSKCLPDDYIESSSLGKVASEMISFSTWKAAMAEVQRKLTLKDASKHAYCGGETLVGREKELSDLLTFFRAAIRGDPGVGGVKSSLICAGPPGVGKTACVRAAIAKLQDEQEKGLIPNFRFISLNGIEQRHPFDAYIRFWEALSGKKHIGSHEKACEKLEEYFVPSSSPAVRSENKSTIVVLLDEIDYLITEKQSVLYNFFDWPKRAATMSDGRRLVVVGISNTLNLTANFMPSVQSRIGTEKCIFRAYSLKDTVSILKFKIGEASRVSSCIAKFLSSPSAAFMRHDFGKTKSPHRITS